MRNLLVVLLVGGLVFLGYEFARRGRKGSGAREVEAHARTEGLHGVALADLAAEGAGEGREPAGAAVEPVAAASGPAEADALRRALRAWTLDALTIDEGARARFAAGSVERYAVEVALARSARAPDPIAHEGLADAAAALRLPDRATWLAAGVRGLSGEGAWCAAIAAMGPDNAVLAVEGAEVSLRRVIAGISSSDIESAARAIVLSRLVDRLTAGQPIWKPSPRYGLLSDAYVVLQKELSGLLFRRSGSWHSMRNEVKRNETLDGIAQRVERELEIPMSPGLLRMINGIRDPRKLRAGVKLRIPTDRMRVVVEKSTHSLKVFLGDVLFRLYEVGLGRGGRTPVAEFVVEEKERKPSWTHPETGELLPYGHPRNVLGDYFIKLANPDPDKQGFGIHGTADRKTVGTDASMGCIRLRAGEMRELFDFLPRRCAVRIR